MSCLKKKNLDKKLSISCFKKISLTLSYFKKLFHILYIKKKQLVLRYFLSSLKKKEILIWLVTDKES